MRLESITDDDGKFSNIDDALTFAFIHDARSPVKLSAIEATSPSTNPDVITHIDSVTQAAMIFSSINAMSAPHKHSIQLNYTRRPEIASSSAVAVGTLVAAELSRPKWFVADICRQWAGAKMNKTYGDWAHHLGKTEMTLHNWVKYEKPGIYEQITHRYNQAHTALEYKLYEKGIITL